MTTKFRSIGVVRIAAGIQFRFSGEDADWDYWPEGRTPDFASLASPEHLIQRLDGKEWVSASHWARDPADLANEALQQARADGKARRERQEQAAREAAKAEAQRLREEAAASTAAAKAAEQKARELEAAEA